MFLFRLFVRLFAFALHWGAPLGAAAFIGIYSLYGRDLPTVGFMKDYSPPTVSRFHAADGQLIAEHSVEKRLFVPFDALPEHVVGAFLSAEDKDFFRHGGVDYLSLAGALVNNFRRYRDGRRLVGASTISQQVAKTFLTGNERSIGRKVREALIAWRLEAEFSKREIFELYVNEVEFGQRAFGVAAAALTYFNTPVKELTVPEAAYLAAILKGPANYHPSKNAEKAKERRDWVISQMLKNGYVGSEVEALLAKSEPVTPDWDYRADILNVPYFAQELKRRLDQQYTAKRVMEDGLSVRSTLDPVIQDTAERHLQAGLIRYDRRHGWRGPLGYIPLSAENRRALLAPYDEIPEMNNSVASWRAALVYALDETEARILFADGSDGTIPLRNMTWARPWKKDQKLGPPVKRVQDVLGAGQVVAVSVDQKLQKTYALEQIPDVQGAVVVLDPHTGRVHALVGGYDHTTSQFNRATQAIRQPGSTFKPFVYLAALDTGMTPNAIVMDSPVIVRMENGEIYKPGNSDGRFLGGQPMKIGLEKSRNLMTLRLAQKIGMERISGYARDFGIDDKMRPLLSMALGSGGTTLMQMTGAYAILANGGKYVRPTLLDRVQDRHGKTVSRLDVAACPTCRSDDLMSGERLPVLQDKRRQVANSKNTYHIVSMLQGVVQRGTARAIGKTLTRPVAGKTGTTNNNHDAWFIGFTPNLVIGVWVGFDRPRTLGKDEYGGRAAAPIFRDLLEEIMEGTPPEGFTTPKGFTDTYSDPVSGALRDRVASAPADQPAVLKQVRRILPDGRSFTTGGVTGNATGITTGITTGGTSGGTAGSGLYDPYGQGFGGGYNSARTGQPGIDIQPIEPQSGDTKGLDGIY